MPVNLAELQRKANTDALSKAEIEVVLARAQLLEAGLAWLASCTAATYEGLPRSASKRERAAGV